MRWSKEQIRTARMVTLAPLLRRRGCTLKTLADDNYCISNYEDLIIKENYWRWPSRNLDGNTIDFFTKVEKLTFSDTMTILVNVE